MDIKKIPAMKPVLVEHVSDDINVLQRDDVTKQKTVLTARAIQDVFKCAPISKDNDTDKNFFNSDDKIDLNNIVEAQYRWVAEDTYVHDPEVYVDVPKSATKWSANYNKTRMHPDAIIYVFSLLDSNELVWENYDGMISIDDAKDQKIKDRVPAKRIKQIYMPLWNNQYYNITHRSRYDRGTMWTRVGTLNEDNTTYTFEDWYKVGPTHHGAKYANQIRVSGKTEITNPLYDSIYHIYTQIDSFTLPNANYDGYFPGMKIAVEVHPSTKEGAEGNYCRVFYTDTNCYGSKSDPDKMSILITPKIRRNTKDVFGNVVDDVMIPAIACFEIVEISDPTLGTIRTWELDGGVEETDFTAGLAQMLGEHTDLATGDLVRYQSSEYNKSSNDIDILHPATTSGYCVVRFLRKTSDTDANWTAKVTILNPNSDAAFTYVDTLGSTPDPDKIYYVQNGVSFSLADNTGHPTSFSGVQKYYSLNSALASVTSVIKFAEGTAVRESIKIADLPVNELRGFSAFVPRGSVIHINISTGSDKVHGEIKDIVNPMVFFFPDPHDSYIQKASINPSAYTYGQLDKLFSTGGVISDINLAISAEVTQGLMNSPASTRALVEAYTYLATKLQNKGLLLANREALNTPAKGCDDLTHPGSYFVVPNELSYSTNTYPPTMKQTGCNIIVVGNDHAPASYVHDDDGEYTTYTQLMQIAFMVNETIVVYTRIGTLGEDGKWAWTPWVNLTDWEHISNKPIYFRARWDYFEDPDWIINKINDVSNAIVCSIGTSGYAINSSFDGTTAVNATVITDTDVTELMKTYDQISATIKPEYQEDFRYQVPQIMVGVDGSSTMSYTLKNNKVYHIIAKLPAATASQLGVDKPDRRRKIRFLFYGDTSLGFDNILLHVVYANSKGIENSYSFVCEFGGHTDYLYATSSKSVIRIEFEQVDMPNGERIWCPKTVG